VLTAIDLFCGAGGITQGFKQAGFHCLYGNDVNQFAIRTFRFNHPEAWADARPIERLDPHAVHGKSIRRRKQQHGFVEKQNRACPEAAWRANASHAGGLAETLKPIASRSLHWLTTGSHAYFCCVEL